MNNGSALLSFALISLVGLLIDVNLIIQIHYMFPSTPDGTGPPIPFASQLRNTNESNNFERDASRLGSNGFKNISTSDNYGGGTAFCLLIKDDNDILSEWIAYHYHTLKMRRLIVAVDHTSKTMPLEILESWRDNFDLDFDIWNDKDYMPDPSTIDLSRIELRHNAFKWVQFEDEEFKRKPIKNWPDIRNRTILGTMYHNDTYVRDHQEEVREELMNINCHRNRQVTFASKCLRRIKEESERSLSSNSAGPITWAVHTDTDEFIVPNPWITEYIHNEPHGGSNYLTEKVARKRFTRSDLETIFPEIPFDESLWLFFHRFFPRASNPSTSALCITMQRILFGSKEDDRNDSTEVVTSSTAHNKSGTITVWNHRNFESLRWKYHTDFEKLRLPKNMINVGKLNWNNDIFSKNRIETYHQIHPNCIVEFKDKNKKLHFKGQLHQPFAIYHFLGSRERYFGRNDSRRTDKIYDKDNDVANLAFGDNPISWMDNSKNHKKRWWIGKWLDSFVKTHGSEKVYTVLGEQYANRTQTL